MSDENAGWNSQFRKVSDQKYSKLPQIKQTTFFAKVVSTVWSDIEVYKAEKKYSQGEIATLALQIFTRNSAVVGGEELY